MAGEKGSKELIPLPETMDVLEIAEGRDMLDVVQGESMKTLNVTMLLAVSC